jgi:hypothetical protein
MAASRRQGLGHEHHSRAADASDKGSGGGAHRCGGVTVGRSGGSVRTRGVRVAPNRKMAADEWVSPGGDGDGGGQKCAMEGRGGSVAGVDERRLAWPCAEESEGEKRRGERRGVGRLFEEEVARQGRGVRLSAAWRAGMETEEGAPGAAWDSAAVRQRPTAARPRCARAG